MKRIAVKIGSNVLTKNDGRIDLTRISSLVDQVCELRKKGLEVIIISSGAVASGRSEIGKREHLDSVSERQLYSAVGQAKLMNSYYDLFKEQGYFCGQVLTTKENFSTRHHYLNQKNCMEVMLSSGVIPIVNENDTISITELMFTDNDELSGLIATMMDVDLLVILSNVDGIYSGNPSDPESRVIREIEPDEKNLGRYIQSSKSQFGRGGMLTKCSIAQKIAREGIPVIIANGKHEDILNEIVDHHNGVVYTLFKAGEKSFSGVKKWIAHSEGFAKGSVTINQCAEQVLHSPTASSLLPVGITAMDGEFEKNDIVKIMNQNGELLGVGRAAYDSRQLSQTMGQREAKPFIRYDYLYLE